MEHSPLNLWLVAGAAFLLVSVLASKASAKLGIPALAVFLVIGMLAGTDGIGGLPFDNIHLAHDIGVIALGLILFAGGLDTPWKDIKPIAWRALSLSTVCVAITAASVALFANLVMGINLNMALLLGAVVSSTDAAAVFGVLKGRNIELKNRLGPLLEAESGSNDAMAVFLTVGLISLATNPSASVLSLLPAFLLQMPLGLLIGWLCGMGAVWLMNRVRLEYDGLYPVITLATAGMAFGGAGILGGNAFLAVYVAGLTMASKNYLHRLALMQFHDGLAWLMQIAMFLTLGLLVYPSDVIALAPYGIAFSLFVMLIARPLGVFASLFFDKDLRKRDKLFVSWAGLRGAVPIVLAIFPMMAGLPNANVIFNLVFFIVLTSVVVQATTLGKVAKLLDVIVPRKPDVLDAATAAGRPFLLEFVVQKGSRADGKAVVELNLPHSALLLWLKRERTSYIPRGATVLHADDVVLVATRREDQDELRLIFEGVRSPTPPPEPFDDMVIG